MMTGWLRIAIAYTLMVWLCQPLPVLAQPAPMPPVGTVPSPANSEPKPALPASLDHKPAASSIPAQTIHPAAADARLFAVPVVESGKSAWVSVYDQAGRPVASVSVLVNGLAVDTDKLGQACFTVPDTQTVTIKLAGNHNSQSASITYSKSQDGWLVSETYAADAVDGIENTVSPTETAPVLAYAPAAVETDQSFVVVGKNLAGTPDTDHIVIDGYNATVFAGSTASLLARTPKRIGIGPLRELYVTSDGENSNTLEIDVCTIDVTTTPEEDAHYEKATIRLLGTNIPSLVELRNLSPDVAEFAFGTRKLGSHSSIVSPGGENNSIMLRITKSSKDSFDLDTHLVADAPWSPEDGTTFGDINLRKLMTELNRAEIIRLKRRMVAVENRISEEQENRTKALAEAGKDAPVTDGSNAHLRLLSNRSRRINSMLLSRRAVFQALGGTDAQYRQALEDATGNTVINLEKNLQPITSAALLAATTSAHEEQAADAKTTQQTLEASRQALDIMRRQTPGKSSLGSRLAPPPEPYIPNENGSAVGLPELINLKNLPGPGSTKHASQAH